jgi:hypothetical protein
MQSPCCLCPCMPRIKFWTAEPVIMKLGMYIMVPEPISTAYFINPSHLSVCVSLLSENLFKNVTAATNEHTKIEELVDASFSTQSVSYRRKVGN